MYVYLLWIIIIYKLFFNSVAFKTNISMFYALVKVNWFGVLKAFEVKQSKAPPLTYTYIPYKFLIVNLGNPT